MDRLGQLGRSALRLVSALDAAAEEPEHGPGSYVAVSRKVLPGWVLAVLAAALLLPGARRLDRRVRARAPTARGRAGLVADDRALDAAVPRRRSAMAELLVLLDQAPDAGAAPSEPGVHPLDGAALAALGACAATALLAWLLVRPLLRRRAEAAELGRCGSRHLARAVAHGARRLGPQSVRRAAARSRRSTSGCSRCCPRSGSAGRGAIAVVLGGLLPPMVAAVVYLDRLALDPLEGALVRVGARHRARHQPASRHCSRACSPASSR